MELTDSFLEVAAGLALEISYCGPRCSDPAQIPEQRERSAIQRAVEPFDR